MAKLTRRLLLGTAGASLFLLASANPLWANGGGKPAVKQKKPVLGWPTGIPCTTQMFLSYEPRLGEATTVTFSLVPSEEVPLMEVRFYLRKGVELISGDTLLHSAAKRNEMKEFSCEVRFVSSPALMHARAVGAAYTAKGKELPLDAREAIERAIVDEETGQFGTVEEYRNSKLEFRYNPADGMWLEVGEPGYADWNRQIIALAKKLEPALSDSEALCLHADIYNPDTPYKYLGPVLPERESLSDEELMKYLLEQGWLKKHRKGDRAKKKWLEALSAKHKKQVEELKRKGIWKDSGRYLRRFIGQWRFKDHHYDKDQGLLADFDVKPVKSVKARIFACYVFQDSLHRKYSDWVATDDTGSFSILTDWDYNVDTAVSWVCPVVFPCGPDPASPAINVSDPNITIPAY